MKASNAKKLGDACDITSHLAPFAACSIVSIPRRKGRHAGGPARPFGEVSSSGAIPTRAEPACSSNSQVRFTRIRAGSSVSVHRVFFRVRHRFLGRRVGPLSNSYRKSNLHPISMMDIGAHRVHLGDQWFASRRMVVIQRIDIEYAH